MTSGNNSLGFLGLSFQIYKVWRWFDMTVKIFSSSHILKISMYNTFGSGNWQLRRPRDCYQAQYLSPPACMHWPKEIHQQEFAV